MAYYILELINMMPVELTSSLFKELRGRSCRILAEDGWTQSRLGNALGVSQVMAGNYLLLELRKFDSKILVIINLRWDSIVSDILEKLQIVSAKLERVGEKLSVHKESTEAEALIDEGGYGFEPSLYIIGKNHERVCKIVENLGQSMEVMA
jgi:predicted fused transcriptional regulator/phosphomethylpyrimidine kinase